MRETKLQTTEIHLEATNVLRAEHTDTFKNISVSVLLRFPEPPVCVLDALQCGTSCVFLFLVYLFIFFFNYIDID